MNPVAAAAAAAGGGGARVVEELEWKAGGVGGGGVEDAAGGGGVVAASQQQQQQQQPPQRGVKRSSGGGGPVTASTSEAAAAAGTTTTTTTCTEAAGTRVSKRSRRERPATAKERISKIPPSAVGKRSSIYRGVTRHRWTGRYEAHLWDKSTWNQAQNKKGKQVYLGAYDEEEAAARAYDLAALKYWGPGTVINFPVSDYARDVEEMQTVSREEYLASLRRKSSGFSRGVSKYRGVARHHHNGRWEARIGRVFGNKYLYLGTYGTQEEAAAAYDMAAIEYRGLNAVTNFDLSRYIKWLRPPGGSGASGAAAGAAAEGPGGDAVDELMNCKAAAPVPGAELLQQQAAGVSPEQQQSETADESAAVHMWPGQASEPYQFPSLGLSNAGTQSHSSSQQQQRAGAGLGAAAAPTALGLLWQSNMFKQMLEKASAHSTPDSDSQHEHDGGCEPDPDDVLAMSMFPTPGLGGMHMVGMDDDPTLMSYEEGHSGDAVYHDMPPFPSSCFAADGQELDSGAPFWNSLPLGGPAGAVLPMRSPITV